MLNFVKNAFRGGLEAVLWLNLIFCVVSGGVFANMTYSSSYHG